MRARMEVRPDLVCRIRAPRYIIHVPSSPPFSSLLLPPIVDDGTSTLTSNVDVNRILYPVVLVATRNSRPSHVRLNVAILTCLGRGRVVVSEIVSID